MRWPLQPWLVWMRKLDLSILPLLQDLCSHPSPEATASDRSYNSRMSEWIQTTEGLPWQPVHPQGRTQWHCHHRSDGYMSFSIDLSTAIDSVDNSLRNTTCLSNCKHCECYLLNCHGLCHGKVRTFQRCPIHQGGGCLSPRVISPYWTLSSIHRCESSDIMLGEVNFDDKGYADIFGIM